MYGNKGTSFGEVRPRFVEMSKLSNDGQELNDSGTTHALRSETASICSRQNWSRYGDGITDQSFDYRVARRAPAGEQQTLGPGASRSYRAENRRFEMANMGPSFLDERGDIASGRA